MLFVKCWLLRLGLFSRCLLFVLVMFPSRVCLASYLCLGFGFGCCVFAGVDFVVACLLNGVYLVG